MRLKEGLPQLTSSKVVFRTFLVTLKQTDHAELQYLYNWLSTWFWKGKTSWKHPQINLEASFFCLWLWCYQWFPVLNLYDECVPSFYRFHVLKKQNVIKTNSQTDQVTWVDQRHVKVKSYENRQLKLKIVYWEESIIF